MSAPEPTAGGWVALTVGLDVVHLPAFARQLETPGSRFVQRAFTARERAQTARGAGPPAERLAGLWAAKEATVKALSAIRAGQPPLRDTLPWDAIEVVHDAWGRPTVHLRGAAASLATQLGVVGLSVSISHDGPVVAAVVVATHTRRNPDAERGG